MLRLTVRRSGATRHHASRSPAPPTSPRPTAGRAPAGPRWRLTVVALVGAMLTGLVPVVLGAASGAGPGQRIDMKLLLLTATAGDPTAVSWKGVLDGAGVPYEVIAADSAPPITSATLGDAAQNRAYYQGIILTDGDLLVPAPGGGFTSALAPSEWDAIRAYQSAFGIRRLSDGTQPGASHGYSAYTNAGDQGGPSVVAQLTSAGRTVFPELRGPVPIEAGSFGYRAQPLPGANFTTLVTGPDNSAFVGLYTDAEGREEMVVTVTSNRFQTQNQLMRRGMISWVTRGVYIGYQRNYFTMHIDDVFAKDAAWDPASNTTPEEMDPPTCGGAGQPACVSHRMTPADTAATIAFQNQHGFTFDMVFNGLGHEDAKAENGGTDPLAQDPAVGLLQPGTIAKFRWTNHTWSHQNLDPPVGLDQLLFEINRNRQFATDNNLPINPTELVTGQHSGLGTYFNVPPVNGPEINPNLGQALAMTGIETLGDDNSAKPQPRAVPRPGTTPAWTVPRHPSNVYFNVASREDQLDEYNYTYLPPPAGNCQDTEVTTCRSAPATWAEYVDSEAGIMFDHVLGNDPRPHYAHQTNLMVPGGNGILFGSDDRGVLDVLFGRYEGLVDTAKAPLVQPTQTDAGAAIHRAGTWLAARPSVVAYLQNGQVHLEGPAGTLVPVTGTSVGDLYAGERSGWMTIPPPSAPVTPPVNPPIADGVPPVATAVQPRFTSLRMSVTRFAPQTLAARRAKMRTATTVSWRVSAPTRIAFVVQRRVGKRWVTVGSVARFARAGAGAWRFAGVLRGRALRPGAYRLVGVIPKAPRPAVGFTILRVR